jgi:hypothetical protein
MKFVAGAREPPELHSLAPVVGFSAEWDGQGPARRILQTGAFAQHERAKLKNREPQPPTSRAASAASSPPMPPNHATRFARMPKTELQGSRTSSPKTLQSHSHRQPEIDSRSGPQPIAQGQLGYDRGLGQANQGQFAANVVKVPNKEYQPFTPLDVASW